jgi:hypothetical protein
VLLSDVGGYRCDPRGNRHDVAAGIRPVEDSRATADRCRQCAAQSRYVGRIVGKSARHVTGWLACRRHTDSALRECYGLEFVWQVVSAFGAKGIYTRRHNKLAGLNSIDLSGNFVAK